MSSSGKGSSDNSLKEMANAKYGKYDSDTQAFYQNGIDEAGNKYRSYHESTEGGTAESRSYEGSELTAAAIDSLTESGWAATRGTVTGGPVSGMFNFVRSEVSNATDVSNANKMGVSLDDARLAAKHDSQSTNKSLLSGTYGDDDDDDGGYDPGDDGFGGFGGDHSKW